mmetsp:Transcript_50681/g.99275  ORF Transcript_50681/g.99275 Transcript_50681/m.99275 type:complete len:589 (-) Transcript_50681:207-1973(-)|eukprot:CAMPEP_0175154842 /NCGR_PEP_ID=MMETSP0087-20121206/20616_1 /TAXON_ID=136419 /ORGANISM="Unknown Unknown, Strain D1" /LENGTH=588 /DNA_ID=CAMNT_0016441875 /DNA_START=38 /DNA_END=1804 /DNA_ORIENTATION=-
MTTVSNTQASKDEARARERRAAGPWLHAWHDPVAGVKAFSQCVRLCDVRGDGENKLLIADANKILKVYKGTDVKEHAIPDVPNAMACFYSEEGRPQVPSVAVAAGPQIFIFRDLRPFYKFKLPSVDIEPSELEVWASLKDNKMNASQAVEMLSEARDNGIILSSQSMNLLAFNDPKEQEDFVEANKDVALQQQTTVTCMETLNKNKEDPRAISMLVVGTESAHVIITDQWGTSILKKIQLPSVPVFMAVSGTYEVEYRIVVSCRNGNVYTIKKGKVVGTVIELETQPCGLELLDKSIIVGCMDNVIHSFHIKGKKNYSIYLPESITNMTLLTLSRIHVKALVVALSNGEVRMYNKKHLVATLKSPDVVTAMRFGPYSREEASLILCYKSGALGIKMLSRHAKLDVSSTPPGPPPEQDIPLNVPKITKLYVEQTQRERDQAIDMHRIFQRDLCKMRLSTARSFVKIITDGQGPLSNTGTSSLRLDAKVQGLGPLFKLKLSIKNSSSKALLNTPVTYSFNNSIYRLQGAVTWIPVLLPSLEYKYEIQVECLDENGAADAIRVYICSPTSTVPAISAIVNMPVSEVVEKEE